MHQWHPATMSIYICKNWVGCWCMHYIRWNKCTICPVFVALWLMWETRKSSCVYSTPKVKLLGLRLMPVTEKFFVHPVISEYIFILFISFYQEMVVVKRWVLPPTLWTIGTGIHYHSSVHGHSNPLPQFSAVRNSNPRRQFSALRHSNRLYSFLLR